MLFNENTLYKWYKAVLHKVGSMSHQKQQDWRLVKNVDFGAVADRILMASKTLLPSGVHTRKNSLLLRMKTEL